MTHLHGGHSNEESDGYPEAWYLPQARNIPPGYARTGSLYQRFRAQAQGTLGQAWTPGSAVFQYENDQRAATMWYHDHTLGMTRANVYAGPAGFYLLRGGPDDAVQGTLPGPAPALGDPPGLSYYEIPIAIQDRSFNSDGALFYPDSRAFFEGLNQPPDEPYLDIPFSPDAACTGASDVAPIWNPEFFGNTIVVNGKTWPFLEVEQRRYRFRFLNGCNSRFLILRLSNGLPLWQIGNEGGFLPAPVRLEQLLMGPAERADVIVDFTDVGAGTKIILQNLAPDEPFGGGVPDVDFAPADEDTTGQVMQLRVVAATGADASTPPSELGLPAITPLPAATNTRQVSLNEQDSATVFVTNRRAGQRGARLRQPGALRTRRGGPGNAQPGRERQPARLGRADHGDPRPRCHRDLGAVQLHRRRPPDPHPRDHLRGRRPRGLASGAVRGPDPWEAGRKDTVIAYPDEITRVRALFDRAGLFVWHCHIVEHEDNEMMRPYRIGP